MKTIKIILSSAALVLGLLLMVNVGYPAVVKEKKEKEDRSPLGCKDVGYKYELDTLFLLPEEAGERQSLYFIFNQLTQNINLYQMRKGDSSRTLYLNHVIKPREWAVLSTSEKEVRYICTVDDKKLTYGKIVDCAQSVKVCEYARVKYGMNNQGNFWVVNSNTSGGAVAEVLHYGIIPR
jgi:hypothetical protein